MPYFLVLGFGKRVPLQFRRLYLRILFEAAASILTVLLNSENLLTRYEKVQFYQLVFYKQKIDSKNVYVLKTILGRTHHNKIKKPY